MFMSYPYHLSPSVCFSKLLLVFASLPADSVSWNCRKPCFQCLWQAIIVVELTVLGAAALTQPVTSRGWYSMNSTTADPPGGIILRHVLYCFLGLSQGIEPTVVAGLRVLFYWVPSLPCISSLFPCSCYLNLKTNVVLFKSCTRFCF